MTNRWILAAASMAAVLGFTPSAQAYECLSSSCPRWCTLPVPYGITATSPDIGEATTVTETRRGMDDWTLRSCTDLSSNYTGRSGGTAGLGDGQSLIGWVESGWRHGSSAIGVTGPRWRGDGCIVEADMEMNGVNFRWITGSGSGSNVNTYSIALHEGGHYYGLGHSDDAGATMYFAYTGGIDSIGADDQNGICFLYPGEGGGPMDCTTAGCPAGQECVSGECQPITGDGSFCSPCSSGAECGGAQDFCLQYPSGGGFCGIACNSSADCSGGACVQLSNGARQCIGLQGGSPSCAGVGPMPDCTNDSQCNADERCAGGECVPRTPDLRGLGEECTDNGECSSGVCAAAAGGRCTQLCDGFQAGSCPSGFFCDGAATGSCGEGLCVAGSVGSLPIGSPCSAPTDCASAVCDSGVCSAYCQPGGAVGCPEGYSCQVGGVAGCGACRMDGTLGSLGDACETGEDCLTGECARRGDETFCTALCGADTPCPSNFECIPAGDVSVCVATMTPDDRDDGCGCRAAGTGSSNPSGWLLVVGVLWGWRRRRTR